LFGSTFRLSFLGAQEVPEVSLLETNVNDFFNEAITIVRSLVGSKPIEVTLSISPGIPKILLLSGMLMQVLLNLGSNAVKFQSNGKVEFVVSMDAVKLELEVLVIDQGPGISESFRSRLFQPYQRDRETATVVNGTGLGLCISKRLIIAMGGELGFRPGSDNKGSVFYVKLPTVVPTCKDILVKRTTATDEPFSKRNVSIGPAEQIGKQSATLPDVLIVEDGDVNRLVLLTMLKVETILLYFMHFVI
jgi:nitrogen-specific signal transduction histidine kinase